MGDNLNETSKSPPFSSSAAFPVIPDDPGELKDDERTNTITTSSLKTTPILPLWV